MKIFKETIKYIFTNFYVLLAFSILPSILLATCGNISGPIMLSTYISNNTISTLTLFRVFSALFSGDIWFGILALLVLCISLCLIYSVVDKHMKIGKITFSHPFSRINETLMGVFPGYFILFLSYELFALFGALIIVFINGLINNFLAIVISFFFLVALFFGYSCCISVFLLLVPSQIVAGYSIKDSIIYSTRLTSKNIVSLALGFLFVIIGAICIDTLSSFLPANLYILKVIVELILFNLIIMFYSVYPMVAYYEFSSEIRRDLQNKRKYIV